MGANKKYIAKINRLVKCPYCSDIFGFCATVHNETNVNVDEKIFNFPYVLIEVDKNGEKSYANPEFAEKLLGLEKLILLKNIREK